MKINRSNQWLMLAILFTLVLTACGAVTDSATATPIPIQEQATAITPAMGRINGRVEFQGPPTPASVLYVVNVVDTSQWFSRELASAEGPTPFEVEIPAGNYQVYARQAEGPMAAAYLNPDGSLGSINVPAGQVVSEVLLKFAAPQTLCQRTALPASPDSRFAAIEVTSCPVVEAATETVTPELLATIRGRIEYGQSPPTPTTMLYFISPERWYWLEVPGGDPFSTFEWQVAPGTYQLMAFRIGSETATFRRPAAYNGYLTVTAGQVVEDIKLRNINPDNCVANPFPASPDGRFPALEETCSSFPTAIP